MIYVLSVSGGKDSAALWSWARRTGLTPRRVWFCDTGWEARQTYEYLSGLEARFGERVQRILSEGFIARTLRTGTFPSRARRWCTKELKVYPFRDQLSRLRDETGDDVTVVVGIRAEESAVRASMPEREWSDEYDCEVWRPLIAWSLAAVLAEHHQAGIPVNPLYQLGAERVGCWPCIYGGKTEIRLVAENDPERIDEIRRVEAEIGATMFAGEPRRIDGVRQSMVALPIDDAVAWSKTARGGVQYLMQAPPSGCMRWGLCETPPKEVS